MKGSVALLIFLGFVAAGALAKSGIVRASRRFDESRKDIVVLIGRSAYYALSLIGGITALAALGVNVSAIVASLGLTGFALGFALRDALSNLLGGVLIILYRPFSRGDTISVAGVRGEIKGIDLRYTTVETDSEIILIPNSTLLTSVIQIEKRKREG
ncbi:MAG: mechanosensitive ion channel [Deltaproteobacteria bacterium]|nr:MAG: mechanosensitive ion channel [Deltaproteobacteria bacterium]